MLPGLLILLCDVFHTEYNTEYPIYILQMMKQLILAKTAVSSGPQLPVSLWKIRWKYTSSRLATTGELVADGFNGR